MIQIHNLDVHLGSGKVTVHAVRNVSFTVKQGESFGLVGESGSGKSTVLRVVFEPAEMEVSVSFSEFGV